MELFAKIVDWIQPLTTYQVKHSILGISQAFEYASDKTKQKPGAFSFMSQNIWNAISADFFHF